MKICLIITWIGSLIDMASTLYLCGNGYAAETNPVMHWLLQWPWAFATIKIGVMTGVVLWIWKCRDSLYAKIAAAAGAMIYGGIAVYYTAVFCLIMC